MLSVHKGPAAGLAEAGGTNKVVRINWMLSEKKNRFTRHRHNAVRSQCRASQESCCVVQLLAMPFQTFRMPFMFIATL